jgi:hypothetical protein
MILFLHFVQQAAQGGSKFIRQVHDGQGVFVNLNIFTKLWQSHH